MLAEIGTFVAAERDIEHADIWNFAFVNWLREAEKARVDLLSRLGQLLSAPEMCREDRALRRVALLLQSLVKSEDDGEFRALAALIPIHEWLFRCPGKGAVAMQATEMLVAARKIIADLATLTCLDDGFWDGELDVLAV